MAIPGTPKHVAYSAGAQAAAAASRMAQWTVPLVALKDIEAAGRLAAGAVAVDVVGVTMNKWAADPPRPDYPSATRVRRQDFGKFLPAADNPLSLAATRFGIDADAADAQLAAGLRAYERARGAAEADRAEFVAARLREARGFMRDAAGPVAGLATSTGEVDASLRDTLGDEGREVGGAMTRWRTPDAMPPEVLAEIFLAGIRIHDLARILRRAPRPWSTAIAAEAQQAFSSLANELREWGPDAAAGDEMRS